VHLIGVLDLMGGRAVHARRGDRARYTPVRSALLPNGAEPGDAAALARAYAAAAGLDGIYVADLDAIAGRPPQRALVRELSDAFLAAGRGRRVLLDAGIAAPRQALDALDDGATQVVVGLETLDSFDALREVAGVAGPGRTLFSLDLRDGTPIVRAGAAHAHRAASPLALAEAAIAAGAAGVIVIDLARVGAGTVGSGVDLALVRALRRALPHTELLAGGGVRDAADLARLADAGCDGALVATALHQGRGLRD